MHQKLLKLFFLLLLTILLSSCASFDKDLESIPDIECETFTYNRGGNFSSSFIQVKGAKIDGEYIVFDEVIIDTKYGPVVNFNLRIEGYKRKIDK